MPVSRFGTNGWLTILQGVSLHLMARLVGQRMPSIMSQGQICLLCLQTSANTIKYHETVENIASLCYVIK